MIVVTGGAGFIGSCIVARLNKEGRNDILIVDEKGKGDTKQGNLQGKRFWRFMDKGEFLKCLLKNDLPSSIDQFVHMGACSSTTLTDVHYYRENNFEYSCHVAEWCMKHQARLIYASSAATYGDGNLGYKDDDSVTRKLKPLNLYGKSKQNFDVWVLDHGYETKFVGLKFFNVFGPNEYHKGDMKSVIAKAYRHVVKEGTMRLFKSHNSRYQDGEQMRDFSYVKDAIEVVMFFLKNPQINGIYNLGTGKARTWNDLAYALFKAVGKTPNIEYFEMPDHLKPRYQYFTQADMAKLKRAGYDKIFMPLEDAIKDYVTYLNQDQYF